MPRGRAACRSDATGPEAVTGQVEIPQRSSLPSHSERGHWQSPKPSHADSPTIKSAARVVLGRSVNGELTENESCAFIGDGYAVNRTHGVGNNG
jgi:hypothetical protein